MAPQSPPLRIRTCLAAKREPGVMYFTTRPGGLPTRQPHGWLVGIDRDGDIVLNRRFDGTSQDVRVLKGRGILFSQSAQGLIHEGSRRRRCSTISSNPGSMRGP